MLKIKPYISLLLGLLLSTASMAGIDDQDFGTLIVDNVTSIYDGDTFRANIRDVPPIIGERMSIRVAGIDTPEIRGKCPQEKQLAQKAKQFTVAFLRNAQRIELQHVTRGKYFRIIAQVEADGRNLSQALIEAGLAVPYGGGTKVSWCG